MADVLVVANPYEAERLRRALVAAGHPAVCADGSEGRTVAQLGQGARLVVLAPPLARGDVAALLREFRSRALPVVLIGEDGATEGAAGVNLRRPLDMSALLGAVGNLLDAARTGVPDAASAEPSAATLVEPATGATQAWPAIADPRPARSTPVWHAQPPAIEVPPAATPPEAATAVTGRLDETDVATLLARLYREGFTGHVCFTNVDATKTVYLDGGFPVSAKSNLAVDRMSDHLFREGRLTRAQYEESNAILAESGRKTGAILVERGYLKESELLHEVRRHYEEILFSLFGWETGQYELVPGPAPADHVRMGTHPAALVVEGLRRRGDPARLVPRLGGMLATLRPTGREDLLRDCALSEKEWAAAALMDGRRPLADVARRGGLSEAELARLAWALLVLAIVRHPTAVAAAHEAEWELPPDDAEIDRGRVTARHALVREGDYFEILGVPRDASAMDVQRAHERARARFDPAALPPEVGTRMRRELEEIALVLDEALRILSDDDRREAYKKAIE